MNYSTRMKVLCVLLLLCRVSSTVKHSLDYLFTASYGIPDFPEFVVFVKVDEHSVGHCDGKKAVEASHDWGKKLFEDDPGHLQWCTQACLANLHFLTASVDIIMQYHNQTGGIHILQRTTGCEWDDETGETVGFYQYGYDGEDFIALDLQTLTWTAPTPKALMTKYRWDTDKVWLQENERFFTHICPLWIKKYLQYRTNFMQPTGNMSVSLLQKSPSSPVSCFATGFYPDRAAMFWRKDGEELYEDVEHGEILPNHDETFQMSVDLNISAVKPEDWGRYECVFQLQGVKEDIITKLDKAVIRSNYEPPSASLVPGLVAGLLLLLVSITGIFIWRRNINKFQLVAGGQEISEEEADTT